MHRCIALIATLTILCAAVQAQDAPPPPAELLAESETEGGAPKKPISKEDAENAENAATSTDGIIPLTGDTILFKNGSRLAGVKIVNESPVGVEVQVTDTDTLLIPRKQIETIEYGQTAPDTSAAESGPSILQGQKVSNELFKKLTTAIPEENLEVKEEDLLESLSAIAKKLDVTIEVTDPVKAIAPRNRNWSAKLDAGATLATYLESGVLKSFPNLKVDFPNDRIVVSIKDDEAPTP